jgi:hypothetical protein
MADTSRFHGEPVWIPYPPGHSRTKDRMQALGDERPPRSDMSLERLAKRQDQTSADVMMSHVSSCIERQEGNHGSRRA